MEKKETAKVLHPQNENPLTLPNANFSSLPAFTVPTTLTLKAPG